MEFLGDRLNIEVDDKGRQRRALRLSPTPRRHGLPARSVAPATVYCGAAATVI
jgi:hypothetical protein